MDAQTAVPVSTLDFEPGYEITERVAFLTAERAINPWALSDWLSGIGDFIGSRRNTVWTRAVAVAREEAKAEIAAQAKAYGADIVVNYNEETVAVKGDRMAVLSAKGMAVKVAKIAKR